LDKEKNMDPITMAMLVKQAQQASQDIGAGMAPKLKHGMPMQQEQQAGKSMMPDALSGLMQNPEMLKMFGQFGG
jgi:hypothetical protein